MSLAFKRIWLGALCAFVVALAGAVPAQAAFDDPLFVLRPEPPEPFEPGELPPKPLPPNTGEFEGPCGVAVENDGSVWVSDYYHHNVDKFGPNINALYPFDYQTQFKKVALEDGPCALTIDGTGTIFVNDYHRNVFRLGDGSVVTGAPKDDARPTGVAANPESERLYVNDRDRVEVFTTAGEDLGSIGASSLEEGYGIAVSNHPGTNGLIYVPDAGDETVKVYSPTVGGTDPVDVIDGSETPLGEFVSLRDSVVAVDRVSGEVYVADILEPAYAELPEAVIYVFDEAGTYEGRLKYSIVFSQPVGLAVDNSTTASQGRVYVTTDNTQHAALYAYPPGAATDAEVRLPKPPPAGGVPDEPTALAAAAAAPDLAAQPTGALAPVGPVTIAAADRAAARKHRAAKHWRAKHRRARHASRHRSQRKDRR
jgi:hypothetical protein